MIKILVIESRNNILIWDRVFENGLDGIVEVHYLIFNTSHSSKNGINHSIPKGSNKNIIDIPIQFDRQRNFFNSSRVSHYGHYSEIIEKKIKAINPNFIIGESASFQDYLAITISRKFDIPYLNPMTSRYPINRFAFYKEDTLIPVCGSKEKLSTFLLNEIFEGIVNKSTVPDYMIKENYKLNVLKKIKDIKIKFFSFLKKDPNTPSLLEYVRRTKLLRRLQKEWNTISVSKIESKEKFNLLYAMQMQPESNIDVYGAPFNNQCEIIKNIYHNLDENNILNVKPNPKPFMEVSDELINFAKSNDRLVLLDFNSKMSDLVSEVDLIITVTGTVAIESILTNKPIGVFKKTYFNDTVNCYQLKNYEDINKAIKLVKNSNFKKLDKDQRLQYLNYLNQISYPGRISSIRLSESEVQQIRKSFISFFESFDITEYTSLSKQNINLNVDR